MRKLAVTLIFAFVSFISFSQPPHAINYQAVAHGANGQVIPEQTINVRFSIIDGTINGTVVYQETQTTKTNAFGLFSLAIGRGTVTQGSFDAINWAVGDKFLKVEL